MFTLNPAARLRSCFAALHKLAVTLGTLPPVFPDLLDKYELARLCHQDACHADAIRKRLSELRGGKGRLPALNPQLDAVFEAALRPPSAAALALGVFDVLKSDLVRALNEFLAAGHPLGDAPSRPMMQSVADEQRRQVSWGRQVAQRLGAGDTDHAWAQYLRARLEAAGGIDSNLPSRDYSELRRPEDEPFELGLYPSWGDHPVRFGHSDADGTADTDLVPYAFNGPAQMQRLGIYSWLFHESDVLDYLPPVFYATRHLPFDFHLDLARHLWDEARHSEGGYRGLLRLGMDPSKFEHPIGLRLMLADFDPAELYAMMTQQFEAGSFAIKSQILKTCDTLEDADLSAFLRHDRADETMHVSLGKRWVPELMRHFGHDGDMAAFVQRVAARWQPRWTAVEKERPVVRTLPAHERPSYNKLASAMGLEPIPA